jgi:hypothetical protein
MSQSLPTIQRPNTDSDIPEQDYSRISWHWYGRLRHYCIPSKSHNHNRHGPEHGHQHRHGYCKRTNNDGSATGVESGRIPRRRLSLSKCGQSTRRRHSAKTIAKKVAIAKTVRRASAKV